MKIGVPSEVKNNEFRVAITPAGVHDLVGRTDTRCSSRPARATARRSPTTTTARRARASSPDADATWGEAELLLKVKEPIESEYGHFRDDLVLFTYLHLAAEPELTRALLVAAA